MRVRVYAEKLSRTNVYGVYANTKVCVINIKEKYEYY